jgi:hypothetical protein
MNRLEYLQAKKFIYNDIQREINLAKVSRNPIGKLLLRLLITYPGGANFMAALSLLCYSEFAGKIITGKNNQPQENFETFFKRLGPEYMAFLKSHKDTYSIFRCGLAHEYYTKKTCTIYMLKGKVSCGIGQEKTGKYFLVVEKYFDDFKKAFDQLFDNHINLNSSSGLTNSASIISVQSY